MEAAASVNSLLEFTLTQPNALAAIARPNTMKRLHPKPYLFQIAKTIKPSTAAWLWTLKLVVQMITHVSFVKSKHRVSAHANLKSSPTFSFFNLNGSLNPRMELGLGVKTPNSFPFRLQISH